MNEFMTEEEIVENFISGMSEDDINFVKKSTVDDVRACHHTVGQFIRNHYQLWNEDNPLTKQWFDNNKSKTNSYIKEGTDYHPQHPDAVSDKILTKIWEYFNK